MLVFWVFELLIDGSPTERLFLQSRLRSELVGMFKLLKFFEQMYFIYITFDTQIKQKNLKTVYEIEV